MREYSELELETLENEIMDRIDSETEYIENKDDLIEMLIDSLESRI